MLQAEKIYQKLLDSNIIGSVGKTTFSLQNLSIEVKDVNIIGHVIQEWLEHFMNANNIAFQKKENTQEFPDFLLDPSSNIIDLLEVKAFTKSPNFDIANFEAYARSLRDNAYRLDAKYLIFQYSPQNQGIVIENIWLKNVWEICCGSERSAIKIHIRDGICEDANTAN